MHLLISGIPATGKSSFGKWLAKEHGFVHVDGDVVTPAAMGGTLHQPNVVIDWGFPVASVGMVMRLIEQGVSPWWFDGDRAATRRLFVARSQRGDHPATLADLELQLSGIDANWDEWSKVFGDRILRVVEPDGTFMPMPQRWRRIRASELRV